MQSYAVIKICNKMQKSCSNLHSKNFDFIVYHTTYVGLLTNKYGIVYHKWVTHKNLFLDFYNDFNAQKSEIVSKVRIQRNCSTIVV